MDFILSVFELLKKLLLALGVGKDSAGCLAILLMFVCLFLIILFIARVFRRKSGKNGEKKLSEKTKTQTQWAKLKEQIPPSSDGRIAIRQFARIDMEIEGSFSTDNHPAPIPCLIKDISLSGLGFFSNSVLKKGSRIRVNIPTLNPDIQVKSFTVSGQRVRITPIKDNNFDYGIHFFHVFKREEDMLRYLIEKFKDNLSK